MIEIPQSVYNQFRRHGEQAYPHESCGVLLGSVTSGVRVVAQAIPTPNAAGDSTRNRYQIAPLELIRIEREARRAGIEIVGFYHSHPDHPARWSTTDLAEAHWLGCSYVITTVLAGKAAETRSYYLAGTLEEDKSFTDEAISISV